MQSPARSKNCLACGGTRLAGSSAVKLTKQFDLELARSHNATWIDSGKGVVATKCGKCKKIVLPTATQRIRMQQHELNVHEVWKRWRGAELEQGGLDPEVPPTQSTLSLQQGLVAL